MAGPDLDLPAALTAAREMGAAGWAAAELLLALRTGFAEGLAARVAPIPDAGGVAHGG